MTQNLISFLLKSLLEKDRIAIYSANLEGIGLAGRLQALGFKIRGFVDSRYYKNNAKKNSYFKTRVVLAKFFS